MKKTLLSVLISVTALCLIIFASCSSGGGGAINDKEFNYSKNEDYSTKTNVQEQNIDEADICKMVGDYIINLQSDGITVTKTNDGELSLVAKYTLKGQKYIPFELYANSSTIIAIGGLTTVLEEDENYYLLDTREKYYYSYKSCEVNVFDISDLLGDEVIDLREKELYSFSIDGRYLTSRLFANTGELYLATEKYGAMEVDDSGVLSNANTIYYNENGNTKTYDKVKKIEGLADDNCRNVATTFVNINVGDYTKSCTINSFYGINLFDLYVSDSGIYPIYESERGIEGEGEGCYYSKWIYVTDLYMLKLARESLGLVGSRKLENHECYGRYAVKDFGDYVFIATTINSDEYCVVYAYDENLMQVGESQKFAIEETIKSVAYESTDENRYCYVTTYRNTDPLFKLDITNPQEISIVGEYSVAGYSTYMYPAGEGYLVTIGYDGDEFSANRRRLKVTLFDVSGDNPVQTDYFTIDNVYYCEAINEPKAFCLLGNDTFAFSAYRFDKSCGEKQGLYVFRAVNGSLENVAYISNFDDGKEGYGLITDFSRKEMLYNKIYRAFAKNGYLYTVSDGFITSYVLDGLSNQNREYVNKLNLHE